VVLTCPFFDLTKKHVQVLHDGVAEDRTDCAAWPQRPDSLLIRNVAHGDTIIVGEVPPAQAVLPCRLAKPLAIPEERTLRDGAFELVNLAFGCQQDVTADWDDITSHAGFRGGRTAIFGVPFELVPPELNGGRAAIRGEAVALGIAPAHLFLLVGDAQPGAEVELLYTDGAQQRVDVAGAVPVINGWPPVLEWHVDLLHIQTGGKEIASLVPRRVNLYAVTGTDLGRRELEPTLAALAAKERRLVAEREAVAKLAARRPLFDLFSGHIGVLPVPPPASAQSTPVLQVLRQAGMMPALRFLTPQEVVDGSSFAPDRVWVALWTGGENYVQSVAQDGDVDRALTAYLAGGGTLLALPTGPFPFYYNQDNQPVVSAPKFGLPICGSGAEGRLDQVAVANVAGWEKPPAGRTLTFHRAPDQQILTSVPEQFPFPAEGDLRWRPIVNVIGDRGTYTPLITLRDEQGTSYGDAAAWMEYTSGPLAGGRVCYVWSTLLGVPELRTALVNDLFGYVLDHVLPPPARTLIPRAQGAITVDGALDEADWSAAAPLSDFSCFLNQRGRPTRPTQARLRWDDTNLYVGFTAEDPDVWSTIAERDGPLWEGEVVEVYVDPDGDGRNYKEFEVNPLNTVIDLNIAQAVAGNPGDVAAAARWNAAGLQTRVRVEGTTENRTDRDRSWTCEMAIPLANFADQATVPPQVGDTWRLQLYRIERPAEPAQPEFSSWSPTDTFHDPARFGFVTFGLSPYADDFEHYAPGSSGAPMWRTTAGTWRIEDGALVGEDSGTDGWAITGAVGPTLGLADYNLQLRFRILERGSDWRDGPWIGVRQDGRGRGYVLVFTGRSVEVHKVLPEASTGDANPITSAPWLPDGGWHELLVRVRGSAIAAEVDGRALFDTTDTGVLGVPALGAGGVALSARKWSQSTGHTRVAFDDIRIEPLK